jgi:hypothetical protein
MMDVRFEDPWLQFNQFLERPPSEYWYRSCAIGASFMSRQEVLLRDRIGVDGLMYGNDYPHVEGIWPQSAKMLHEIFAGVPVDDVRKLAGLNAARLYRLDVDTLNEAAARVGPVVDDIVGGEPSPPETHQGDRIIARAARPASWVFAGVPRGFELRP